MTDQETPVSIEVDEDTGDRFLVYSTGEGLRVDLHFHGEELWMSQAQISQLFAKDRTSITKHIQNIFQDEELTEETSVQKVHKSMGLPQHYII